MAGPIGTSDLRLVLRRLLFDDRYLVAGLSDIGAGVPPLLFAAPFGAEPRLVAEAGAELVGGVSGAAA